MAVVAAAACGGGTASFRPTTAESQTRSGEPAAVYEIRDDGGARAAQVVVWSQGAYRADDGTTVVHVATELQNVGGAPVSLDASSVELQPFDGNGAPLPAARLSSIQPAGAEAQPVAPGTTRAYDLYFTAPGVSPDSLGSLRLRWAVAEPDGHKYVQFTDFNRDVRTGYDYGVYAWVPVYGFYDPFWVYPAPVIVHRYHVPVRRLVMPSHVWRRR